MLNTTDQMPNRKQDALIRQIALSSMPQERIRRAKAIIRDPRYLSPKVLRETAANILMQFESEKN